MAVNEQICLYQINLHILSRVMTHYMLCLLNSRPQRGGFITQTGSDEDWFTQESLPPPSKGQKSFFFYFCFLNTQNLSFIRCVREEVAHLRTIVQLSSSIKGRYETFLYHHYLLKARPPGSSCHSLGVCGRSFRELLRPSQIVVFLSFHSQYFTLKRWRGSRIVSLSTAFQALLSRRSQNYGKSV